MITKLLNKLFGLQLVTTREATALKTIKQYREAGYYILIYPHENHQEAIHEDNIEEWIINAAFAYESQRQDNDPDWQAQIGGYDEQD